MTDEQRAEFDRAQTSGQDAAERAKYWARQGRAAEAEEYLLKAARELDAALHAIGSKHHIRIEPEQ